MAPPLYFFARQQRSEVIDDKTDRFRPDVLRACGLEEVFRDVTSVRGQAAVNELTAKGPGGASGVLATVYRARGACDGDILRTGYHPDFQEWRLACAGAASNPANPTSHRNQELWIGIDKEHPPKPEDLLRSSATRVGDSFSVPHPGWTMELADGRTWEFPVVRRPPICGEHGRALTSLPMDIGWDEYGAFCETIKPAYQQLWRDAGEICDFFFAGETPREGKIELGREKALTWCLRILALNYRYGRHEQTLLRAIDQTNVFTLLGLAIDAPLVHRLLAAKKNTSGDSITAASSTTPGETDDSEPTAPAAASCY